MRKEERRERIVEWRNEKKGAAAPGGPNPINIF